MMENSHAKSGTLGVLHISNCYSAEAGQVPRFLIFNLRQIILDDLLTGDAEHISSSSTQAWTLRILRLASMYPHMNDVSNFIN
jgi:hypothetical protein